MTLSRFDKEFYALTYIYFILCVCIHNSFLSLKFLLVYSLLHWCLTKLNLGKCRLSETLILKCQFLISFYIIIKFFLIFLMFHFGQLDLVNEHQLFECIFGIAECSGPYGPETYEQSLKISVFIATTSLIVNYSLAKFGVNSNLWYNLQKSLDNQIYENGILRIKSDNLETLLTAANLTIKNQNIIIANHQLSIQRIPEIYAQLATEYNLGLSGLVGGLMGLTLHNYLTNNSYRRAIYHADAITIRNWYHNKIPITSHDLLDNLVIHSRYNFSTRHFILPMYFAGMGVSYLIPLDTTLKLLKFI